jgi:hypothetical protein
MVNVPSGYLRIFVFGGLAVMISVSAEILDP